MKSTNQLKFLKGKIFRFSLIFCLGFCINFSAISNPMAPPPMITEIHFGSGTWSIELWMTDFFGESNLDNMRIVGLYDTAQFVQGISFTFDEVLVVTQDDFSTPFYINQSGDFLNLEEFYNGEWISIDYCGLPFGNIPAPFYSDVSASAGDESIAWQMFSWSNGGPYFWTVKELPNTLGYNPLEVSKRAVFSGYVKDKNDGPLAGIMIDYADVDFYHYTTPTVPEIFTDENGYFYTDNMFCKKYHIDFLNNEGEIGSTLIYIEPDSANYFEFQLDTLLTGITEFKQLSPDYSIHNIPNPLSNQTTFIIEANGQIQHGKGIIKIYSNEGYIVDILPIEISGEKQELTYNLTEKSLAAGMYYYNLEIGHEKKASGKMVVGR